MSALPAFGGVRTALLPPAFVVSTAGIPGQPCLMRIWWGLLLTACSTTTTVNLISGGLDGGERAQPDNGARDATGSASPAPSGTLEAGPDDAAPTLDAMAQDAGPYVDAAISADAPIDAPSGPPPGCSQNTTECVELGVSACHAWNCPQGTDASTVDGDRCLKVLAGGGVIRLICGPHWVASSLGDPAGNGCVRWLGNACSFFGSGDVTPGRQWQYECPLDAGTGPQEAKCALLYAPLESQTFCCNTSPKCIGGGSLGWSACDGGFLWEKLCSLDAAPPGSCTQENWTGEFGPAPPNRIQWCCH